MHFHIYSRKSVYTGKGESIENQVELCRAYILANYPGTAEADLTVYEDEGFSGKSLDRPQFQRMMQAVGRTPGGCIVCYRLDRISRSVGDFAQLIETLQAKQVSFLCIREKFDTGTPMGKAMMYIASVFAQLERETIAERVRDNMLLLAKTGRWLGGQPPTGFRAERRQEVLLDGKKKTACLLREAPEELALVDAIFECFLTLHSVSGVRAELARRGLCSRTGRLLSLPGIKEILQNPVYCTADQAAWSYFACRGADVCFDPADGPPGLGLLAYNKRDYTRGHAPRNPVEKWVVARGRHRGRVPGERWVAVQALLSAPGPEGQAARRNEYALLSGLVRCAGCGGPMLAKTRAGRPGQFDYICQSKLTGGAVACSGPNLTGPAADDLVRQVLGALSVSSRGLRRRIEGLGRQLYGPRCPDPAQALRRRLAACDRESERLMALLSGTGDLPLERVAARLTALDRERSALLQPRDEGASPPWDGGEAQRLGAALAGLPPALEGLTLEEQRALVRLVVQTCTWDGQALKLGVSE